MANMYINAMTALWNSVGTVYSAIKMNVSDSGSASTSKLLDLQVSSVERFTVKKNGDIMSTGLASFGGSITGGGFLPTSADGGAVGSSALPVSDLFLASGGVINWAAADVTITHSSNALAFAGATSGYSFDDDVIIGSGANLLLPASGVINWNSGDVTVTHSANALAWAGASNGYSFDAPIMLPSGGILNFNAGDVTVTHTTDTLTVAGGDLRVTTAGTNAASVVTNDGIQTLANKTLTSPALTGNPTAPTATAGDNDTSIATTGFVKAAIPNLNLVPNASTIVAADFIVGTDSESGYANGAWQWATVRETARAFVAASGNSFTARQTVAVSGSSGVNSAGGSDQFEVQTGTGGAAMISFHRAGAYAANFGLHTDNVFRIGGWSMGAVAHEVMHAGNIATYVYAYVPGAMSGAGADTVGSYAYARINAGFSGFGGGAAGGNLSPVGHDASGDLHYAGTMSGSWRCMGYAGSTGSPLRATLWLRYA